MKTNKTVEKGQKHARQTKGSASYAVKAQAPMMLREAALACAEEEPMVRTQIYLSKQEHQFVQQESARQGQPMAAIIRGLIEARMEVPETAWTDNPLLAPPADNLFEGPEDGIVNLDHYVYGTPKKWVKQKGQWVEAPPLPEDYHTNPASAAAYDRLMERKG